MLFGQGIAALTGDTDGHVTGVEIADGRLLPANLVLAGVGVAPGTELAEAAGLAVDGGIVTDARLLTADPCVSAVGDCACSPIPPRGRPCASSRCRTRSTTPVWSPTASPAPNASTTSCPGSGATILRDPADRRSERRPRHGTRAAHVPDAFSVLLFRDTALVAVESVNRPADHMAARRLLASGVPLTPEEAATEGFTSGTISGPRHPTPVPAA
ncbi:Oxidoreductase OS=Streptomyces tendae OX=1932 GN=GUR47_00205 PE=4 SV=1 [Streptomyces tendae]